MDVCVLFGGIFRLPFFLVLGPLSYDIRDAEFRFSPVFSAHISCYEMHRGMASMDR